MGMKWYIVNTLSGCEKKAKELLEEKIRTSELQELFGEVLVPTETTIDNHRTSGRRTTTRKFFPGYMLVQMEMTDASWHLVNSTPKVSGFVGDRKNPPAMSEAEVEAIKRKMNINIEKPDVCELLTTGSTVRVLDGPFVNFTGSVESIDKEKRRVSVNVSILGRVVPVELDFSQVEQVRA